MKNQLKKLFRDQLPKYYPELESTTILEWINASVGTVHTFQGKQANGGIMCLGCDEAKISAASWQRGLIC